MPLRLVITFLLALIFTWPTLAAAQEQPAKDAKSTVQTGATPSVQPKLGPHPRIWLNRAGLDRLRQMAARQTYNWRKLIVWAEEPERGKHHPQDGPGLALTAAILAKEQPDQARRLGKLAVTCALRAAPRAISQGAGKRMLRFDDAPLSEAVLWEAGFHLIATGNAPGKTWRVERYEDHRLLVKTGQPALGDLAAQGEPVFFLTNNLAQANQLAGWAALALDWGWDFFSPKERQTLSSWLVAQARVFKDAGRGCFSLESMAALRLSGLAALAAHGQDPGAPELLQQALDQRFRREVLPCLLNLGRGGGWFGGEPAGAKAGLDLLEFTAAAKSAMDLDLIQDAPWFKDRLALLAACVLPGVKYTPRGGFNQTASFGDPVVPEEEAADLIRLQMQILLALRPGDQAAGLARALVGGRRGAKLLAPHLVALEMLWQGEEAGSEALAFAPLTHVAPAVGLAFSRSDWSPLATWLAFSCGPHYSEHQHLDAGAILLWRQGFLLPHAGAYDGPLTSHSLNYAIRSVAHNTVLIHDPKEYSWPDLRQGVKPKGTYSNDGGQRSWSLFDDKGNILSTAPWTASGWDTGNAPWNKLRNAYQVAGITASREMPRYFYLRGDMTKAYQGSTAKASRVVRHVFHLRAGGSQDFNAPEAIAVVDDIMVARKDLQARFALHFGKRPQLTADLKSLGKGRWSGPLDRLKYAEGQSLLEVRCLWPLESRAWMYGGEAAGSWVNGKNYPPQAPAVNPAPWRVEIGGHDQQSLARPMVHVLLPAATDAGAAPETTLLISNQPEVKGLVIHDPRWPRVVAVRLGEPDPLAKISYKYPPGPTRHLVAGLIPGVFYSVKAEKDMVTISPGPGLKTGPAGALSFVVEPKPAQDKAS
jgi:hypothetical protein